METLLKHLNWVYTLVLLIGLAVLIPVGFIQGNVIGYIVYISITAVGGFLVLWGKRRLDVSWVYWVFVFTSGFGFPIAVLCLRNKRVVISPSANT